MSNLFISPDLGTNSSGNTVSTKELDALKELGDVIQIGNNDINPSKYDLPNSPFLQDYLAMQKLSEIDLDKIYICHMYSGPFTNTIRYLKERDIITTLTIDAHNRHESIKEFENLGFEYPFKHVKNDRLWEMYNAAVREADIVITPSELSKKFLKQEGAKDVRIIPHGIDVPAKVKLMPDSQFIVGYIGACLLPDSPILTFERGLQKIKDIKVGDKVLTHKGRFMRINQLIKREYNGDMIKIIPSNLRSPIILTPEHKILAITTSPCISRPGRYDVSICRSDKNCYFEKDGRIYKYCKYLSGEEPFTNYKLEWIEAKNLKKGDFVVYPKANEEEKDIKKLNIFDWIDDTLNITTKYDGFTNQYDLFGNMVQDKISMNAPYSRKYANIPVEIDLTIDLMRLFGYFIAEGDVNDGRKVRFAFHTKETEYHRDVENIMKNIFGLEAEHDIDEQDHRYRIIYSNKLLGSMFENMFQNKFSKDIQKNNRKANLKIIPSEFLNLPLDKLAELIKGEWRGDGSDYDKTNQYNITTTSETLAHQLIYLLSKFGILASLKTSKSKIENHSDRYDIIISSGDNEIFENIIGEKLNRSDINNYSQTYQKGKKLFYIQIKDIDITEHNGYVWNLEVEKDNSYVSYIALHNCGPDKGIKYIIQSWSELNYQDDSICVFAGANSEYLEPFVRKYATNGKFHLMGFVKNISDFYNKISVYIQPSVTEAFGMEILEAMVHGRPVIVSEGCGAADVVTDGDTGFIVPKRDIKELEVKIQYFKDNSSEIIRMGKNAREKSYQYQWSNIREKYIDLWRSL